MSKYQTWVTECQNELNSAEADNGERRQFLKEQWSVLHREIDELIDAFNRRKEYPEEEKTTASRPQPGNNTITIAMSDGTTVTITYDEPAMKLRIESSGHNVACSASKDIGIIKNDNELALSADHKTSMTLDKILQQTLKPIFFPPSR